MSGVYTGRIPSSLCIYIPSSSYIMSPSLGQQRPRWSVCSRAADIVQIYTNEVTPPRSSFLFVSSVICSPFFFCSNATLGIVVIADCPNDGGLWNYPLLRCWIICGRINIHASFLVWRSPLQSFFHLTLSSLLSYLYDTFCVLHDLGQGRRVARKKTKMSTWVFLPWR